MLEQSKYVKIKVTVPKENADEIRQVLGEAGAGKVGNYEFCSYSYPVTGRFRPLSGANPTIGKVGELETVEEECIECICDMDILDSVIIKLKEAHPYEEPVIDVIELLGV